MANLKTLRKRIRSVSNTKQITKAMKMVAAAKLRRAQERAFASRPYSKGMDRLVRSLSAAMASNDNAPPLLVGRGVPNPRVEIL
ncbi:MAG: F0F1 ATP synthase subunit gamma, partial [Magnetococcales bacterium]|nr:F0F1 ATP synthase subunit gamma [Magnetococcales bacterium]